MAPNLDRLEAVPAEPSRAVHRPAQLHRREPSSSAIRPRLSKSGKPSTAAQAGGHSPSLVSGVRLASARG